MNPITAGPSGWRTAATVAGIAGAFVLSGCAVQAADAETEPAASKSSTSAAAPTTEAPEPTETTATTPAAPASTYADGSYTATGSYQTPESVEEITVTVTLESDIVTGVEITGTPTKAESRQYQSQFIGGIAEVVVGQDLEALSVSRVAGSSLTSGGFNQAIEAIRSEAAA